MLAARGGQIAPGSGEGPSSRGLAQSNSIRYVPNRIWCPSLMRIPDWTKNHVNDIQQNAHVQMVYGALLIVGVVIAGLLSPARSEGRS